MENIERIKEHKKKINMKKKKEHREIIHIYKERLKISSLNKMGYRSRYLNRTIGNYLGISESINLDGLSRSIITWKFVNKKIQKDNQIASVSPKDKSYNLFWCEEYLRKNEFISHIWVKYKGKVPASSFINQPPLISIMWSSIQRNLKCFTVGPKKVCLK